MAQILCIANPKGGSTKTSTAVNLGCAIAPTQRRVLLVDLDPAGAATAALRSHVCNGQGLAACYMAGHDPSAFIQYAPSAGFDLLPSDSDLTAFAALLRTVNEAKQQLSFALQTLSARYDLIILDTPPTLDLLTVNALCAAHHVLIPTPCEYYALDALRSLIATLHKLEQQGYFKGDIIGIVRTLYDENAQQSAVIKDVLQGLGDLLCASIIPYAAVISEASALGRPVMLYDKSSSGARAYLALAGELLARMNL